MAKDQTKKTNYEALGKRVEQVLINDYLELLQTWKRFLLMSFLKGVMAGFGSVIGATLVVGLILWILNFFGGSPLVGDFLKSIGDNLKQ